MGNRRKQVYKRIKCERGASAVEFALVLPILILLVMGIIQFGIIFNNYISITHAAREGVRWAALRENEIIVKEKAIDAAPSLNPPLTIDNINVSITNPTPDDQGKPVSVKVQYDVPIDVPIVDIFFPSSNLTLESVATQRIE